jgi:hypothetical protein
MNEILYLVAGVFVTCLYIYLACGLLFSFWFLYRGAQRIDPGIAEVSWTTKWIFIPGSMLLWIYLWKKCRRAK